MDGHPPPRGRPPGALRPADLAILVLELEAGRARAAPTPAGGCSTCSAARPARRTAPTTTGPGRYLVLLPETGELEAGHVADRIERGLSRPDATSPRSSDDIRIEIAVARRGADPLDAIDDAARRLDGIADEELEDAS